VLQAKQAALSAVCQKRSLDAHFLGLYKDVSVSASKPAIGRAVGIFGQSAFRRFQVRHEADPAIRTTDQDSCRLASSAGLGPPKLVALPHTSSEQRRATSAANRLCAAVSLARPIRLPRSSPVRPRWHRRRSPSVDHVDHCASKVLALKKA